MKKETNTKNTRAYSEFLSRKITRETMNDYYIMLFRCSGARRGATPVEIQKAVLDYDSYEEES